MPKREEDPALVGLVIAFDPEEETRRYEEEERLAKQKRKSSKHSSKKAKEHGDAACSSSKCSGATGSTTRTNSEESTSATAIPDKIVTTTMPEDCQKEEKKTRSSSRDKEKSSSHHRHKSKSSHSNKKKSSSSRRVELRKCKSERHLSKRDLKKMEKKAQKKEQKRQRKAAKTIQKLARGYLARKRVLREEEEGNIHEVTREVQVEEEVRKVGQEQYGAAPESPLPRATTKNTSLTFSRMARFTQTISWSGGRRGHAAKEIVAASSVQRAYRAHVVRRFWRKGNTQDNNDKDIEANNNKNSNHHRQRSHPREAFRKAWQNFFIFNVLSPMKTRLRQQQKAALMMGGPQNDDDAGSDVDSDESECSSDSETAPFEPHLHPLSQLRSPSPYLHHHHLHQNHHFSEEDDSTSPDLLDAIPEDKTYSASSNVGCMLAPLSGFAESDDDLSVSTDELMAENISIPRSPSTVTTSSTALSLSPHRFFKTKAALKKSQDSSSSSALHASCPNLRLESI